MIKINCEVISIMEDGSTEDITLIVGIPSDGTIIEIAEQLNRATIEALCGEVPEDGVGVIKEAIGSIKTGVCWVEASSEQSHKGCVIRWW